MDARTVRAVTLTATLALTSGAAAQQPTPAEGEPPAPDPIEVTVAQTRVHQTSGSAHVIPEKQLERFENDDPHKILPSVPGVYVRGEDGFGLRPNIGIRGAVSDRSKKVTLMEDGILFGPAPYSAPAAYYFPLMTRMRSVRVVKGPAAISYGPHTVGGAVDLLTATIPDEHAGMVDLAFGEYGYRKLHLRHGASLGRFGVLIEGVHLGSSGFKELDGGGDTGFSRNEWMLKGRYILDPDRAELGELELKAGYSDESSDETYLGLTDADFRETPYRRYGASRLDHMDWTRTQIQLSHRAALDDDLVLTTTAYRHDLHRAWRKVNSFRGAAISDVLANPGSPTNAVFFAVLTGAAPPSSDEETLLIGPNDRTFVSEGIQFVVTHRPETGPLSHRLEWAVRLHHDGVRRIHTEDGFLIDGTRLVPERTPTATTQDNEAESWALSMHAIDAVTWGRVTLTPGVRVENVRGEYDDFLTGRREGIVQQVVLPGVGLYVALPHDFGALAGVYQGSSPVPPGSTQTPKPEMSVNYEAGVRWSPRKLRVEWIGFYNDYSNLTDVCTISSGCLDANLDRQFDAGSARVFGFEAYAESEVSVANDVTVPGRLAYTFTDATFRSDFDSADPILGQVRAGDELPYVPAHQLALSFGIETKRFGANVGATYVGAMREIAGQGPPLPGSETDAQFLLDAAASVRPLEPLTVYATVKNLLDDAYLVSRRPYGARPNAPRWIQVGAKVGY